MTRSRIAMLLLSTIAFIGCQFDPSGSSRSGTADGGRPPVDAAKDDGDAHTEADAMSATDAQAACGGGCDGTCEDGTCIIDCPEQGDCSNQVVCPADAPCRVTCGGMGSCAGGVDCSDSSRCEVACGGPESCANEILCGAGRCDIECTGGSACQNGVTCSASCACDVLCTGGACADPAECPLLPECDSGSGCTSDRTGCDTCGVL